MATYFVTGAAGFIGYSVSRKLLDQGHTVIGFDNLNDYYSVALKEERLAQLNTHPNGENFTFIEGTIADAGLLKNTLASTKPDFIIHLAAQAGVRYSLTNPDAYVQSNLVGHMNVLEAMRHLPKNVHLVYASSSSVYGGNEKVPFHEDDRVDTPCSLYAATKKADELMSHAYCHLHGIKATGLRFFTVYGPWGRPDMSPMLFASAILEEQPIKLFDNGDMWRDFTYIDDIVEGILRVAETPPTTTPAHDVYNIGNNQPVRMDVFVKTMEDVLGKKAIINNVPAPKTEVYRTYADTSKLEAAVGYKPNTDLKDGLQAFADWFKPWHAKQQ